MDLLFGLALGLVVASPLIYGAWRLHRTAQKFARTPDKGEKA